MKKAVSLFVCVVFLAFSTCGHTVGFYNPDQGAKSQGMANAFVALTDDPSAAYFNPAGMVWIEGLAVQLGGMVMLPDIEYTAPDGSKTETQDDSFFLPNVYITGNIPKTDFWVGLSVNVPFGLATDWGANSFARFVSPDSELTMSNINPSVAYRINDNLSIAAGVDYYVSDLSNRQDSPLGPVFGLDDTTISSMSLDVDGGGWGWNTAMMYRISEKHSFGLSYRSKVDATLDGDLEIANLPAALGMGPGVSLDTEVEFKYPAYLKAGYAFRPNDRLSVEFDVDWLDWSHFDEITIEVDSPGFADIVSTRNWEDSFIYAVGVEYDLNETWSLRAGYAFADTPVPDETFIPDIPRNDLSVVSAGAGYCGNNWRVDAAYTAIISADRDVENNVGAPISSINGNYDGFVSVIGLNFTYGF